MRALVEPGVIRADLWEELEDGRFRCDLCPRHCQLRPGQKAFCFVREARRDGIYLTSYGRAIGLCIDPIEKKPLNHFYPGSSVLSFGTAGCNLGCRFCQNWDMSKAKDTHGMTQGASPEAVAEAAIRHGCKSVAFTYNDPIVFAEYAADCAEEVHARGLANVAVSNGYITDRGRELLYARMDAINVDLKGFTEEFYHKLCFAHLEPVLETLQWIVERGSPWLEITTLMIPGHNDDEGEVERLVTWVREHLGDEVPLHFTAFHPDFKMLDVPSTPAKTLSRAREQALELGLKHVYTGNVRDPEGQSTFCAGCGALLIGRDGYWIGEWHLDEEGACRACGKKLAGFFDAKPGGWGSRRQPVLI